jgi:hypothetical protein
MRPGSQTTLPINYWLKGRVSQHWMAESDAGDVGAAAGVDADRIADRDEERRGDF